MLASHGRLSAAAFQPRLPFPRAQSRGRLPCSTGAGSHLEPFTYRPQPSPLKVPSLERGWILSHDYDTHGSGLEILLSTLDQEHGEDSPQPHELLNRVEGEKHQYLVEGNGVRVKSINDDRRFYQNKDQNENSFLTRPNYMRGPDIDKNSFIRIYYISALRVPARECWDLTLGLREHLLNWPRVNNVGRVMRDDVDGDLETLFSETSVRTHRVTQNEIRAAIYADSETALSSNTTTSAETNGIIKQQDIRPNREAASVLELMVSDQEESPPAEGVVPYLNGFKKWTGPTRLLLLDEKYAGKQISELPSILQAVYSRFGYLSPNSGLVTCRVSIFYDYWSMQEELLPADVRTPVTFDRAGHVAELSLHPEHLPYRHVIAQVTLDKCKPTVRSVVIRRDKCYDRQSAVQLELLAGSTSLVTTAWEHDIPYRIDIASVIWDPRFRSERQRLINSFSKNDVICDLCSGAGSIAIPASKKVRRVYANEVNPHAHFYLTRNVVENNVSGKVERASHKSFEQVHTVLCPKHGGSCARLVVQFVPAICLKVFNEDAQTFLSNVFDIERPLPITQLVMSHPFAAAEFLEFFQGAFSRRTWPNASLPRVHLYSISRAQNPRESFFKEIAGALGSTECEISTRVAKMACGDWMVSATFVLPARFGFR